ncbi:hypothetical protein [Nocardiopsis tropica]|uniref:Uncharacterized protein n=1 Tax=Nocardiopsis tropica TaxID=109330 RepID=A0ABU7KR10_9ACTN|nr:hypothetical protein [Nocardiopsis umidischolae]MEE2051728.1 hypothetical protein [Nocardiopsis umidischolae]
MARNFAKLHSSTWTDDHFKSKLTVDSQWLYFALLSQANINAAGVLPLQDRKWRKLAKDHTPQRISAALAQLQAYWYVIVDEDTEEVLARTFIRNDGIWKQPNVLKGALNHAKTTMSDTLKAVIWHEVDQLPLGELEAEREAKTRALVESLRPTLLGTLPEGFMEPPREPYLGPFQLPEQDDRAPVIPITRPAQENPQVNEGQPPLPRPLWEGSAEGFRKPSGAGAGAGEGEGAGESLGEELVPKTSSSGATSKSTKRTKKTPDPLTERAQAIAAPFWEQHKTGMAQSFISVRQVVKTALGNGVDEAALASALQRIGEEKRPVSGGTIQVALNATNGTVRPAAGGYQPYQNPTNQDVYDEGLL